VFGRGQAGPGHGRGTGPGGLPVVRLARDPIGGVERGGDLEPVLVVGHPTATFRQGRSRPDTSSSRPPTPLVTTVVSVIMAWTPSGIDRLARFAATRRQSASSKSAVSSPSTGARHTLSCAAVSAA